MIVDITDDLRIERADDRNWQVIKRVAIDQTRKNVKNTHRDVPLGYYGTFSSALVACSAHIPDTDAHVPLEEALKAIQQWYETLQQIAKEHDNEEA